MKIKIPYFGCLALVMLIMLSPIVTLAQGNSIRGKVQDEQGNVISGATIKIKGTKTTVPSAADGTFEITNLTISEIILQVSFLGYQPKEQRATLGQFVTITLLPANNTMDEVFVTGTFDKRKRMDASVAISTLDAAQIEKSFLLLLPIYLRTSLGYL